MEFAWNTAKNQMSDVKGKEREQEREGKISNEDIDLERTVNNYDLVQSDLNLYQRVKERVADLREKGSRVQNNSVVMYSNVLTVPTEQAEVWGEKKTDEYFKACYEFFCDEFGEENVVSAKIHKDETTPHMHLQFVPVNKETGKLQARVVMTPKKINYIHDALPKLLRERGFDVVRGSGKTKDKNIENVHEFKEVKRQIAEKEHEFKRLEFNSLEKKEEYEKLKQKVEAKNKEVDEMVRLIPDNFFLEKKKEKKAKLFGLGEIETKNYVFTPAEVDRIETTVNAAIIIKSDHERLRNTDATIENVELKKKINVLEKKNEVLETNNIDSTHENNLLKQRLREKSDLNDGLALEVKVLYDIIKTLTKRLRIEFGEPGSVFRSIVATMKEKRPDSLFAEMFVRDKTISRGQKQEQGRGM